MTNHSQCREIGGRRPIFRAGAELLEDEVPLAIGRYCDVRIGRRQTVVGAQAADRNSILLEGVTHCTTCLVIANGTEITGASAQHGKLHRDIHCVAAHQAIAGGRKKAVDAVVADCGEFKLRHSFPCPRTCVENDSGLDT